MNVIKNKLSVLAVGVIAALFVIGAGVLFYLKAPSDIIGFDINPSIEIHTNRLGQVVSVDPVNDDAKALLVGYELKDQDLETVIHNIVDRLILNGYLTAGQENNILVTTDDKDSAQQLGDKVNTVVTSYLQEKQVTATVLQQKIDINDEVEKVAHKNQVSAGKMALIDKILQSDSSLSKEELLHTSVRKLLQYTVDHNISLEDLITNYASVIKNLTKTDAAAVSTDNTTATEAALNTTNPAVTEAATETGSTDADTQDNGKIVIKVKAKNDDADEQGDNEDSNDNQKDDSQKASIKIKVKAKQHSYQQKEDADEDDQENDIEEADDSDKAKDYKVEDSQENDDNDYDKEDNEYSDSDDEDQYSYSREDNENDDQDKGVSDSGYYKNYEDRHESGEED